ncbi:MAG: hypothetical protein LBR21_05160 [Propionibacteriaceae bacterium]|nr:hypothetical protein [Propionibacteriaceae bacterium]
MKNIRVAVAAIVGLALGIAGFAAAAQAASASQQTETKVVKAVAKAYGSIPRSMYCYKKEMFKI